MHDIECTASEKVKSLFEGDFAINCVRVLSFIDLVGTRISQQWGNKDK